MRRLLLVGAIAVLLSPLSSLGNGLAIHWTFDELDGSGKVPDQAIGNGAQDGSPVFLGAITIDTNVSQVGGGSAYFVNGTGDEILWQDAGNPVTSGTNMTASYWFKTLSGGTRSHLHVGQDSSIYHRVRVLNTDSATSDRELRMTARGPGDGELTNNGTTNIRDDEWHHIAYVVSGVAGAERQIYLDGELEITGSAALADNFGIEHIGIGGLVRSNTDIVDHLVETWVDDFQLYNSAISPEQVRRLATNPGVIVPEPGGVFLALMAAIATSWRRSRRTSR